MLTSKYQVLPCRYKVPNKHNIEQRQTTVQKQYLFDTSVHIITVMGSMQLIESIIISVNAYRV